jgi:hypothetical protein
MAGLVPAIHVFLAEVLKDVDARDKPGHDGVCVAASERTNHSPSTAFVMILRWISLLPP